jgi:hypothetical protein
VDIGYHYVAHTIETVWVEDAVPAGASEYGDSWSWISANPAPFSGELALQSDINPGYSSYFFYGASDVLVVNTDDTLVAYVFLDPENTPAEIGLWWYGGGELERRTWWAASGSGTSYMGPLPPAGQWMRLEVPASQIGLEGTVMSALTFYVVGGRATWDYVGKADRFSPVDSNGDGILDYLEDANGNGLVDSGEIAWNIPGDLGLKVIITRPRNGSTLP